MHTNNLILYFESTFDELYILESIIKFTQEVCMNKEEQAEHYNLAAKEKYLLSNERNHYINMLATALEKVENIKTLNLLIEQELSYLEKNSDNCG